MFGHRKTQWNRFRLGLEQYSIVTNLLLRNRFLLWFVRYEESCVRSYSLELTFFFFFGSIFTIVTPTPVWKVIKGDHPMRGRIYRFWTGKPSSKSIFTRHPPKLSLETSLVPTGQWMDLPLGRRDTEDNITSSPGREWTLVERGNGWLRNRG